MKLTLRLLAAFAVVSAMIPPSVAQSGWWEDRRRRSPCADSCDRSFETCRSANLGRKVTRDNLCGFFYGVSSQSGCQGGTFDENYYCNACYEVAESLYRAGNGHCSSALGDCYSFCPPGSCEVSH